MNDHPASAGAGSEPLAVAAENLDHCQDGRLERVANATLHHERIGVVLEALTAQFAVGPGA